MVVSEGFKKTELGKIPINWEVKSIGEVVTICGGGTPSTNVKEFWDGNINWFTPTEIGYEKYLQGSLRKLTISGLNNSSAKILQPGTILMTSRAGIGDLGILKIEAATNQGFQSLIANPSINNEFLYYLMFTKKNELLKNASGSTFLEISPSQIKSIKIALPPQEEQLAIASTLSDSDNLIANLEKLIKKKTNIKQGVMQQLLMCKKDFEVKKLGDICEIKKGQLITEATAITGDIPVIAGGKKPSYYHNKANRFNRTITISGSGANAGFVAYFETPIFASDCSTIEESSNYSLKYVFYNLQMLQNKIYKAQTGGAQPHIHPSDLKPLEISFPKLNIQNSIAATLTDLDIEIDLLEKKLSKIILIKQGMMQNLLTGKIRLV
jgi:type I restriction enzyme S subunit